MPRRIKLSLFVFVTIACIVPFLRTAGYGFTIIDDYEYCFIPEVESGLSLQTFVWGFTYLSQAIWMPLTWCSYALDYSLFGGTPGGMHVHNVILHGLNCGLLFLLLSSLLKQKGWQNYLSALLVALFWGLHPLRVEPVAWIASRKDVLSLSFELLALLLWVKHLNAREGQVFKLYGLSFLFFVLATMAKPSAMTFPVIALLLDVFVVLADENGKWNWKKYIPLFIYAAVIAVLAQNAQASIGATTVVGAPLWWRVLNAVASYGIYLFHTVWPSDLAVQCVCRWPAMPRYLSMGLVCVSAVGLFIVFRLLRHWKSIREFKRVEDWPLAGFLMFTLVVGPFLGIASFGYHAYSDRFTYVPSLGLCVLLLGLSRKLSKRALIAVFFCLPILLAVLGGLSWYQLHFWKDDVTLFRRTVEVEDDTNAYVRKALTVYFFELDHSPEKLIAEYERTRDLNEKLAMETAQMYIIALYETGQLEKGAEELSRYQRFVFDQQEKDRIENHREKQVVSCNFCLACAAQAIAQCEYDIAENHIDKILEHFPDFNYGLYLQGAMLLKQGYPEKALAAWRKVRPNYINTYVRFRWLTEKLPADDAEALKILPSLAWKEPDPPAK